MSNTTPTMEIQGKDGPVRINVADFDANKHTAANGSEAPTAPEQPPAVPPSNVPPTTTPPAPPAPPATADKYVTKTGKKWFVTDKDGKPLDAANAGYDTEAEAQAAIKA